MTSFEAIRPTFPKMALKDRWKERLALCREHLKLDAETM